MTTRQQSSAWTVLHVVYPTTAARLRLLGDELVGDGLFGDGRAYFADLPIETPAGPRMALEVALPQGAPTDEVRRWLEQARAEGLVDAALRAGAPLVLEPSRFPAGRVPPVYGRGLAIGSARAVALLRLLGATDAAGTLPGVVRSELAYTYQALIPDAAARQASLREHAAWLEALADRHGMPALEAAAVASADGAPLPDSPHRYEPLRRPLAAQAARVAARAQRQGDVAYAAASAVRTVLAGRLAHTQVVRLCGLESPYELRWEAALVRHLAASISAGRREERRPTAP